jgi:hypothetical protein
MKVIDPNFASKPTLPSDASEERIRSALSKGEPVVFPKETTKPVVDASWIREIDDQSSECNHSVLVANAEIRGPLALPYIVFQGLVWFVNCRFRDQVDFTGSEFKHSLVLGLSCFDAPTLLRETSVAYDLNVVACDFRAPLSLADAEVKQVFSAYGAAFEVVEFNRLHVGKAAFFLPAMVEKTLRPARFNKQAKFLDARFDVTAEFDGAEFMGDADFTRMTVGAHAFFRRAEIAVMPGKGGLYSIPMNERPPVRFAKEATFLDARFGSIADFHDARFAGRVDFARASVQSDLLLINSSFESTVDLSGAEIGNALLLKGARCQAIELRHAKIPAIETDTETLIDGPIDARALSHERFEGDWRRFTDKLEPFTRDPFDDLEKYLRRSADEHEADAVYYERRIRERRVRLRRVREALKLYRLRAAAADLPRVSVDLLEWLSGYGVKPLRFVMVAAVMLALGTWAFSQPGAVVSKTPPGNLETLSKPHEAFSYAFATFIPIVRLPPAERWRPSDDKVVVAKGRALPITYEGVAMILQFAGYLVAPLIITIVKTIISRRETS